MNKKATQAKHARPVITAKKHWIVYLFPLSVIAAGIALFLMPQLIAKIISAALLLMGFILLIKKLSFKWHVTTEHIFVESGFGFTRKKYQQMPVFDVYKSSASVNTIGRILNFGTITTTQRENGDSMISHTNISNAKEISEYLNRYVKTLPTHPLNQVYELKEKGIISEQEYNLVKMGHITKQYLA